ncbi:hypothetical protein L484_025622 [Morus notabilis]|uniref:Pentatricopeptide repeat-containing protein n=1 Tax=Morus notabilis TaxID=981085 RepID=W9R8W3_9ROSA|nr:hypothetical protein L484_025622 [Morus notabilis]
MSHVVTFDEEDVQYMPFFSFVKLVEMSQHKQIHAQLLRTSLFFTAFTASKIVALCAPEDSGSLNYARLVLSQISNPTIYTCNSIIRGYTNWHCPREAILFYREMIFNGFEADRFTFPSLFKYCEDLHEGKQLYNHSIKLGFASNSYVQNTLMNMYSNCGCLVSARKKFKKIAERTVVSWATMIGAYAQWNQPTEAFELFDRMMSENVKPNEVTLVNVLNARAKARDLETAKHMHNYVDESGFGCHAKLNTALMDVYCKCVSVLLARDLFDKMPEKYLFCLNVVINGHVNDSDYKEAFLLFREMQLKGEKGDKVTMISLLLACSHLGALELGKWLHAYIKKEKIEVDATLGTTLVDMYAKCGGIESAINVFQQLPEKDVMTWTALITGLTMCGEEEMALEYFHEMRISGVKPYAVTFVGVLAACSHADLADDGISHFNSMSSMYGIKPSIDHYGCMVDLLDPAGRIGEAEELIRKMPIPPDRFVRRGLLGACRIHGNLKVAERAAQQLLELDSENEGTLIEIDGIVHEFVKGDSSHPQVTEINRMLDDMSNRLKEAGYVPERSEVRDCT